MCPPASLLEEPCSSLCGHCTWISLPSPRHSGSQARQANIANGRRRRTACRAIGPRHAGSTGPRAGHGCRLNRSASVRAVSSARPDGGVEAQCRHGRQLRTRASEAVRMRPSPPSGRSSGCNWHQRARREPPEATSLMRLPDVARVGSSSSWLDGPAGMFTVSARHYTVAAAAGQPTSYAVPRSTTALISLSPSGCPRPRKRRGSLRRWHKRVSAIPQRKNQDPPPALIPLYGSVAAGHKKGGTPSCEVPPMRLTT